jgi:hypothetical protein
MNTHELIELVEKQVAEAQRAEGGAVVFALARLIAMVRRDARLSGLVEDMTLEASSQLDRYREHDRHTRAAITELWRKHKPRFQEMKLHAAEPARFADGPFAFDTLDQRLELPPDIDFRDDDFTPDEHSDVDGLLTALQYWGQTARELAGAEGLKLPEWKWLSDYGHERADLATQHRHAYRQFVLHERILGGAAFRRLANRVDWINPEPPQEGTGAWVRQTIMRVDDREARDRLFGDLSDEAKAEIQLARIIKGIKRDLTVFVDELRERVAQRRSRRVLARRFAGWCERYDARALRERASTPKKGERLLTLEFARFLYDQGLNPLVDPAVSGQRPDVQQPESLYVDARIYNKKSPQEQIVRAVGQTWESWARVDQSYDVREAFLLVFRVAGPRVRLPHDVVHGERRLHLQLVDIGPPERVPTLELSEGSLRPPPAP